MQNKGPQKYIRACTNVQSDLRATLSACVKRPFLGDLSQFIVVLKIAQMTREVNHKECVYEHQGQVRVLLQISHRNQTI